MIESNGDDSYIYAALQIVSFMAEGISIFFFISFRLILFLLLIFVMFDKVYMHSHFTIQPEGGKYICISVIDLLMSGVGC